MKYLRVVFASGGFNQVTILPVTKPGGRFIGAQGEVTNEDIQYTLRTQIDRLLKTFGLVAASYNFDEPDVSGWAKCGVKTGTDKFILFWGKLTSQPYVQIDDDQPKEVAQ